MSPAVCKRPSAVIVASRDRPLIAQISATVTFPLIRDRRKYSSGVGLNGSAV